MPVRRGKNTHGPYYQYGDTGHKYYYTAGNGKSREKARARAALQGRAIEWQRHK
jgi:hypothetical protein